ncbi:uncharacterized protein [Apostichopus japonicus]|uniref:uncharacterized protein isoform X5 n=1 Tax=Stichopus japonicus TaxID=307972 RepID=UPI003AB5A274
MSQLLGIHGLHNWPDVFGSDFSQLYALWEQQDKYFVFILFLIYYTSENPIHNMEENICWIATFIGLFLFVNTTEFCDQKPIYLRLGSKGLVSCDFGEFRVIGWLVGEDVDDRSPTILVEDSQTKGPGFESGEYDMFQNGSLIINKVTLQHEQMFTARIVRGSDVEHYKIEVKLYVLPVPVYPVVNGLTNQQHVVIHDYSGGQVNCAMDRVRPNIELELVFLDHVPQDVSLSSIRDSSVNNTDGTYNVSLVSTITVGSNLTGRLRLQCSVAGQMANYFPAVTLIDVLVLSTNFPEVNGSNGERRVVRYVEREVHLTCAMDKALPNVSLEWVIVTPALSNQMLQEQTSTPPRDQVDGTVTINRNLWLRFPPDAIYALLECRLSIGREIVRATTVELIIKDGHRQRYPTVNGLTNQQHVILDINREDELTCLWNGVSKSGYLKWDIINPSSDGIIITDHRTHTRDNGDGTYDLSLHSTLSVPNPSVLRVTLHCKVAAPADQWYPEITTAELLLPANFDCLPAFPVINGLTSQQHVVLDVQRTDVLTCSMHRVSQEVSLQWLIITPDSSEDVSLDDQFSISDNEDGTVNITLNSTVTVTSLSINRVTLQCKVSSLSADSPQVFSTQVELLLPSDCKDDLSQYNRLIRATLIGKNQEERVKEKRVNQEWL